MGALGLALAWFGYWVAFYGFDQLQGGNNSFLSLGIPGQFSNAPKDSPSQIGAAAANAKAGPGPTGSQGNPSGVSVWQSTPPPANAPPGKYRVDQNGNVQYWNGTQWVAFDPGTGLPAAMT